MDANEPRAQGSEASPPTAGSEVDLEELAGPVRSKWPKVIGIISLIYAIGGMLCQVFSFASVFLSGFLAGMMGAEIEVPLLIKVLSGALAVILLVLGLLLLTGSINLLRWRPQAVRTLKTWVVLRLIMLVLGVALGAVMMPSNVDMQMQMAEAQADRIREAGQPLPPNFPPPREQVEQRAIIAAAVLTGLTAVYPLFLGFYLSRRKIEDEVMTWGTLAPTV